MTDHRQTTLRPHPSRFRLVIRWCKACRLVSSCAATCARETVDRAHRPRHEEAPGPRQGAARVGCRARLDAVANEGSKIRYVYDFGDNWTHQIVVEKVLPLDPTVIVPACIDGRRACPPEDCGGPWGYDELLTILGDPNRPEHAERLEWTGGPIDPDAFDPSDFETYLATSTLAASTTDGSPAYPEVASPVTGPRADRG